MNREQRRKKGVKTTKKTYTEPEINNIIKNQARTVVPKEINKIINKKVEDRVKQLIQDAIGSHIAAVIYILNQEYGYQKKRCQKFMDHYDDLFERVLKEEITLDKIQKVARALEIEY